MSKDKSKVGPKGNAPAQAGGAAAGEIRRGAPREPLAPAGPMLSRKIEIAILVTILLGAAALRLADRDEAPPGLNQDEAANGWNAWCLLKTGKDQAGVSWPITYTRALGSNYTVLNMYLLAPLQAIGGLDVWTTRGTAALGGILTVLLIWFVGKRLLGTGGGLLAAGLLALNPWHLFASRWGIEANICPLLAIAPLALFLAARLPPETRDRPHFSAAEKWGLSLVSGKARRPPRIWLAGLAGVVTGLCFYGYPAMLIFLPLFLIAIVAVTWRQWWGLIRGEVRGEGVSPLRGESILPSLASSSVASSSSSSSPGKGRGAEIGDTTLFPAGNRVASPISRRGLATVLAFVIPAAAIFAPLAYMHTFHGEEIRKRTVGQWVWEYTPPGDRPHVGEYSLGSKIAAVAGRYLDHFGPDFLFTKGDHSSIESPPDMGMFHWYMLPLFLLGVVWCVRGFRASAAARVVLAWVLLYPAGDSLGWSVGDKRELCLHSLRSSPGICGLVLLAAAGGAWAGAWLLKRPSGSPQGRNRSTFWAAACGLAIAAAALSARYLPTFFGEYNRRPFIYHKYHTDLVEACRWLRPRLDQYDAVFCTTDGLWQLQRYLDPRSVFIPAAPINQPYIILLHELGYDPRKWQSDPKDRSDPNAGMFDQYYRFGKVRFLYPASFEQVGGGVRAVPQVLPSLEELRRNGKPDRVLFILRPGEAQLYKGLQDLGLDLDPPAAEIAGPDGLGPSRAVLRLYKKTF